MLRLTRIIQGPIYIPIHRLTLNTDGAAWPLNHRLVRHLDLLGSHLLIDDLCRLQVVEAVLQTDTNAETTDQEARKEVPDSEKGLAAVVFTTSLASAYLAIESVISHIRIVFVTHLIDGQSVLKKSVEMSWSRLLGTE